MIKNKKILCVITARAGSRGIPGKNYRELLGKPLFIWSVEAALKSKYVDTIVISSNCPNCKLSYFESITKKLIDINDGTKEGRVIWIDRPDEFATDTSKNEEALIHALEYYKKDYFGTVINLQPTSPCRLDGLLDKCLEKYSNGEYDSLLTASKDTPFLWQKKEGKWEYMVDKNGCCNRKMRQEFSEDEFTFHDNGNIYIMDTKILLDRECRIGYNPCIFETEGLNNIQIDKEDDFLLIEKLADIKNIKSLV